MKTSNGKKIMLTMECVLTVAPSGRELIATNKVPMKNNINANKKQTKKHSVNSNSIQAFLSGWTMGNKCETIVVVSVPKMLSIVIHVLCHGVTFGAKVGELHNSMRCNQNKRSRNADQHKSLFSTKQKKKM
jgi:hypothetical protein